MISQTISHYRIIKKLGAGGMGEVYLAEDTMLGRKVAIKVLPEESVADENARKRLIKEAQAAATLDHPNICAIYEVGQDSGINFIVMQYLEGESVAGRIRRKPLRLAESVDIAVQVADALAEAHARGLIHRDIKPANIMTTARGQAKLMDFGLAKVVRDRVFADSEASTESILTRPGAILGTVPYMSPEQVREEGVDARSDIFSFGTVLYEMVSGHCPFAGESAAATVSAILTREPPPLARYLPDAPAELQRIINKALAKGKEKRYQTVNDLLSDLKSLKGDLQSEGVKLSSLFRTIRRPQIAIPAVLVILLGCFAAIRLFNRNAKIKWAREQAIPEINSLIEEGKFTAAFALARQAEKYIPTDPMLIKLWPNMARSVSIHTTPPGAAVHMKEYQATTSDWEYMGQSPIDNRSIPLGFFRWKLKKEGFAAVEGCPSSTYFPTPVTVGTISFTLDEEKTIPPGMVRIPGGDSLFSLNIPGFEDLKPVRLRDYWIDKYEATNKQFKQFVDHGGYQKREYWKQQFVKDGRAISWEVATLQFRDATGRPGPATWELGDYPHGQDDYPVTGVSWYEAAAYAEFIGKSLPSIYHWNKAAETRISPYIVPLSNFGTRGPARVGSYQGVSPYGPYDMAGNVKEWCWNEAGHSKRYILGGAWDEPVYMFNDVDARSPFDRYVTFGFRCMKYLPEDTISKTVTAPVVFPVRDYHREKPVSNELFQVYKSLYSYDKTPLNLAIESIDESGENWKTEKITFSAAYGNERMIAYLFLPKKFAPPYQTIIFFPGSMAIHLRSSKDFEQMMRMDFIIKGGRAVLYPIYKGTYERGDELDSDFPNTSSSYRDHVINWSKDLGRSIDYLETRPDIDHDRIGYYGFSWGGAMGAILPALENRLKVCILAGGGFFLQKARPQVDQINFAPHVMMPVLMLNGRYDFALPTETAQVPMFRFLGTPKEHKRHVIFETGHAIPRNQLIKEILDWLDRYLGPVR